MCARDQYFGVHASTCATVKCSMMDDNRNLCWQDPNIFLKPFNTTAFLTIVNKDAVKNKKPTFSCYIDLQKIELGAFCFRVCVCVLRR